MSVNATSSEKPTYEFKVAKTKDEIEACYDIRLEVFHVEQGFPSETELDELDPESTHFMLTTNIPAPPPTSLVSLLPTSVSSALSQTEGKGGDRESTIKPVGTVRLTPRLGKVSRLAVDKEFRQYGYGKVIMESLERYVRESKGKVWDEFKPVMREEDGKTIVRLKLHSQMQVVPFYKRYGYVPEGPEFDEEGAPHLKMVRDIVVG